MYTQTLQFDSVWFYMNGFYFYVYLCATNEQIEVVEIVHRFSSMKCCVVASSFFFQTYYISLSLSC